jgi:nitrous oxide reductase
MSRNRMAVVIGVVVVFVILGGILIYARSSGGQNVTFDVTVTGGKTMSQRDLSVHQNDNVTINIKSDTDGEVHLHGYDISFDTKKGQTVSKTFKADKSGHFPIEWESTRLELGQLIVNL